MTSPARSVVVRLALDPSSYIAGAARAEASTLTLDRAVSKVGPNAATSMERAAAGAGKAEGSFGKLNATAGALGFTLGGLAGVGAAVAGALSVKWAGDYQSALTRLVTTAGESQKNIGAVGQGFLDMAGQVGISADEIAKSAYIVESAGFHGADALTVMKAATQGARQEQADLGKVTDAVSTILHDYHLKASDAATVTSQLVTAVSHGKTTFDELTGSLHSVTPLAAKMNISLADVTGTLASMTASGESADQATQNMANTLQHLANPTNTMITELAQLGISTDDLATSLSTKGLSGTLQMVEEAIVAHVDPATQRVLLPALNQSKTAAHDLQIMLGQMPPTLAKLAQGLMDGSVSLKDYRTDVRDLGGVSEVMGTQFMNLFQSSQGFSNILKGGGPAAQVFTAAMSKAFGTTAALNVSLQTTGENAGATNAAIKDIAGAAAQADGNIKGWDEVQGNFNQQLAQAEAHAKSLAIEAGQHLLPVLTSGLGWLNSTGVPALEHLGSAAGSAAHWFGELPAPVKDAAGALAALKIAEMLGLLDKLSSGAGRIGGAFTSMSSQMTTAFATAKANQVRLVEESSALWGGATAASRAAAGETTGLWASTATEVDEAGSVIKGSTGNLAGLGAAAGVAAKGGLSALKSGASGLMGLFGGPWGVALIGATAGVSLYTEGLRQSAEKEKAAVDAGEKLAATYRKLGTVLGAQAMNARDQVRDQLNLNEVQYQAGISADTMTQALMGNDKAQKSAVDSAGSLHDRWFALGHAFKEGDFGSILSGSFLDQNSNDLKGLFKQIGDAGTTFDSFYRHTSEAGSALQSFHADADKAFGKNSMLNPGLDTLTKGMGELQNSAGNTQKSLQGISDILAGLTGKGVSAAQATADLTTATFDTSHAFDEAGAAIDKHTKNIDLTTKAGSDLFHNLQQLSSGFSTAVNEAYAAAGGIDNAGAASKAAGDAASQLYNRFLLTAEGAGLSHDAAAALAKQLGLVPGDVVTHFTQPGMSEGQTALDILSGKITAIPGSKSVRVDTLDDAAITELENVGYKVEHLPDGSFQVTAATDAARTELNALINDYTRYPINVVAHVKVGGGSFANAEGAILSHLGGGRMVKAFASGGFQPMAANSAAIANPGTLRIIGDNPTSDEAYIPINGSSRSASILQQTAARMGYSLASKEVTAPPVVRSRELVGVGGGGGSGPAIDYSRLGAVVAAALASRPAVGTIVTQRNETGYELAEKLTFDARTRG